MNNFPDVVNLDVSPSTIIRVLKRSGLNPRRAARKLFLTQAHANLRLEFAFHKRKRTGKMLFFATKKHSGNFKFNYFNNSKSASYILFIKC